MFRRKEEGGADFSADISTNVATAPSASNGAAKHPQEAQASSHAPVSTATAQAAASSHNPYAPSASAARPGEPARPVTASAVSYRPAPVAEFARPAAARPSEPVRTPAAAPQQPVSSFTPASVSEKPVSAKPNRRVLTVGNDILLKGEIATCDRLVIEGRVEAKLSDVHTVEIAECGSFKGTAEVEDAEISGVFEGDLIVRNRLVIYATGEVRGNISYGEIEIERGGRLTGQIKTVTSNAAAQAGKAKSLDASPATAETKARTVKEPVAA